MEFIQTSLKESLNNIFIIANKSFNEFYPKDKFLNRIKDKKYWIFIAKDKKIIVGFKIFYLDYDNEIYDWLDAVLPEYRRKGISTSLMNLQIRIAKKLGCSKIKLKTHDGHPEMIELCKKFGFVEVKREPHHWRDSIDKEAIFFELKL